MTNEEELEMSIINKEISENNWFAAKTFIDRHPRVLNVEFAASRSETPLHVAAKYGHVGIVEELVRLVSPEYLELRDAHGYTPLCVTASYSGAIPIAKCLINANGKPLEIPTIHYRWMIPVTMAFRNGFNEMGRYLYFVTPLHVFEPRNDPVGPTFVGTCFGSRELEIALDLLQRCKELLFAVEVNGLSTVELIAFNLPNPHDKSQFLFWKQWIYHC